MMMKRGFVLATAALAAVSSAAAAAAGEEPEEKVFRNEIMVRRYMHAWYPYMAGALY